MKFVILKKDLPNTDYILVLIDSNFCLFCFCFCGGGVCMRLKMSNVQVITFMLLFILKSIRCGCDVKSLSIDTDIATYVKHFLTGNGKHVKFHLHCSVIGLSVNQSMWPRL